MKKIVTTPSVDIAMRTVDDTDRKRIRAWFERLAELEEMPGKIKPKKKWQCDLAISRCNTAP